MSMVKQSSSRFEQKRISRLELGIRAAQKSGISSDQIKQLVNSIYGEKKHDTEEGDVTRLAVNKWDGEVFDREPEAGTIPKHVVLPVNTYQQFEGKRSQRFSRPVSKIFLDHPELLVQYNVLRDHRFSRFIALDLITKIYYEKRNNNGGHQELPTRDTHSLDLTTHVWHKFMEEHKASFAKMYDMRIHEGLNPLQASNSIFKEMDNAYKATNGKSVFDHIDKIRGEMGLAGQGKHTPGLKVKEWNPELKPRYYKHFRQMR